MGGPATYKGKVSLVVGKKYRLSDGEEQVQMVGTLKAVELTDDGSPKAIFEPARVECWLMHPVSIAAVRE
jgi:hypothetical protein